MAERRSAADETWQTRPRRRAIEAALRRRPDLEIDALHAVLARLGFDVDDATLIDDLDALGYDVEHDDELPADDDAATVDADDDAATVDADDEAPIEAPDPTVAPDAPEARPARRGRADLPSFLPVAEVVRDDAPVAAAPTPRPPVAPGWVDDVDVFADPAPRAATPEPDSTGAALTDDEQTSAPRSRRRLAAVGGAVAALLVVGAALVLPPDDTSPTVDDVDSAAGAPDDAEGEDASGSTEPAAVTEPEGPPDRRDPELADLAEVDLALTFDGSAPELPPIDDLGEWRSTGGDWSVLDDEARVDMGDAPRAVAVLDAPGPDLRAEVTLPDGTSGAGLAFRFEDEGTYLAWVIAPRFYTANLYRVSDGQARLIKNSGVTAVPAGVRVGVHVVDRLVELLVDGVVVATFDDVWTPEATGIGMVSMEPGEQPSFNDLRIRFEG